MSLRVAIVGYGKIARDQHVPAIGRAAGFELAAVASPESGLAGVAHFVSLAAVLGSGMALDAVAICTPPQQRFALAQAALAAGLHVLLEKPPGATVSEIGPLVALARESGRTLFATWHSRFAPAVEPARAFLAERRIERVQVEWKEDVRQWHPGQRWIWQPGGLGVFDPGINALSIVTRMLPRPIFLTRSDLVFPENCEAPIAASLVFSDALGTPVTAEFDWRETGPQIWHIHVDTDIGRLTLDGGGRKLSHEGRVLVDAAPAEYDGVYRRFAQLIGSGDSDVDLSPLQLCADAFLLGRRTLTEAFFDAG